MDGAMIPRTTRCWASNAFGKGPNWDAPIVVLKQDNGPKFDAASRANLWADGLFPTHGAGLSTVPHPPLRGGGDEDCFGARRPRGSNRRPPFVLGTSRPVPQRAESLDFATGHRRRHRTPRP